MLLDLTGRDVAEAERRFGDGFLTLRKEHSYANAPADFHDDAIVAQRAEGHRGGKTARHAEVEGARRLIDEPLEMVDRHIFFAFAGRVPEDRQLDGAGWAKLRALNHEASGEPVARLVLSVRHVERDS